ncbi:hypothetical protein BC30102_p121 (plasmid) [Bacillus cereus]|nr:hypothetical protein BC30102_p121 [Bacillus cereus]
MPNQYGLYELEEIKKLDVKFPIYDFTKDEETDISMDLWTYTDIKDVFGWKLSEELRKRMIRGFLKKPRMKGYAPLYSLREVMYLYVGWSYDYKPAGDD